MKNQELNIKEIDAIGLRCPEPLMIVRRELRNAESGTTLLVHADDQSTKRDFDLLCQNLGYKMLEFTTDANQILHFKLLKP